MIRAAISSCTFSAATPLCNFPFPNPFQVSASHGSNETAKVYADFTAKYLNVPILKGSLTTHDYRFQTYITVTKIDKNKKTVTVKITKTVN